MTRVAPARLAGTWYEGTPARLERQTDALLAAAAAPEVAQPLAGIVVPHAAYQYSGATAAAAYRCVRGGPYRRAVILAPSHYVHFRGAAYLDVAAFATPLGEVAVDQDALALIAGHALVREDARVYRDEHSLEIQLPLLQRTLPRVSVVPLVIGTLAAEDFTEFAAMLRRLAGPHTLFVVSSDLTHYGAHFGYLPFPPRNADAVAAQLRALDMGAIERVVAGDLVGFRRYVASTGITICGHVPISAFLAWYAAAGCGELRAYTTSLALTGDFEHSVSYAALTFARAAR